MKKIICTFLALAMICSLMVVNASAANIYEGEMFEIVTDYECIYSDNSTDERDYGTTWHYVYGFDGISAELEIHIESVDYMLDIIDADSVADLYETFKEETEFEEEFEYEEVLVDGIPAFISNYPDSDCLFIEFLSDNYCFSIEIESDDKESSQMLCDLVVEGFKITDSTSWYEADDTDTDKADKTDKNDKNTDNNDEDQNSDSDNTTIIIVAIVVAGVVVIAVVAIVVLGKKKKQ